MKKIKNVISNDKIDLTKYIILRKCRIKKEYDRSNKFD